MGVHDLIDAGPPTGDLRMQVAWQTKTRMRQGQIVHTSYQKQREEVDASFKREVVIRHLMLIRGWEVVITGRIDGVSQLDQTLVVEEIKSSTLPRAQLQEVQIKDVPSWVRQVELYLYFLQSQSKEAIGRLVLISIPDGSIHHLPVAENPQIEDYIIAQLDWVLERYDVRRLWLQNRKKILATGLPFAHTDWRVGQREMTENLIEGLAQGKQIFLNAATGYGKTAASLYAAISHAYENDKKVFFATSRTTQQQMAEDTIVEMARRGLPVKAISIRARDRICLNERVVCHPEHCPYAYGYHDKVRRENLWETAWSEPEVAGAVWAESVIHIAEKNYVCPFALSIDLANDADVIIGDFNYLFNPHVRLALIAANPKNWITIVDEVHNLPERAMGYGSPHLSLRCLWNAVAKTTQSATFHSFAAPIKKILEVLLDELQQITGHGEVACSLANASWKSLIAEVVTEIEQVALQYAVLQLQEPLFGPEEDDWLTAARSILAMHAAIERASEETIAIWKKSYRDRRAKIPTVLGLFMGECPVEDSDTGLQLLCRDPSLILAPIFKKMNTGICMSATLHPVAFYQDMLGISNDESLAMQYKSPFPEENKAAYILPQVSTAYRNRDRDKQKTAELISQVLQATSGNTAVFFPSFAFRDAILPLLHFGERPILLQYPNMTIRHRYGLLNKLRKGEGHVLLGVLGGIFSEGIDLPAKALVCAVIVGPSLPKANLARKQIQLWYEKRYGQGFRYAWLIPGMSRVVQAAGRVIRSPTDYGSVVFIGRRFLQKDYREFLKISFSPSESKDIYSDLSSFWDTITTEQGEQVDTTRTIGDSKTST